MDIEQRLAKMEAWAEKVIKTFPALAHDEEEKVGEAIGEAVENKDSE
jgi:hypothetical protein